MVADPEKLQAFIKLLQQAIENLEKREHLSNDDMKGLFKTFLAIQIENSKFILEISKALEEHRIEIEKLSSKNNS